MNDIIFIRGLEVSARHGVLEKEKKNPQKFVFDAEIYCDFSAAARSDDLSDTINYSAVCALLTEVAQKNSFNLIEKLARECASSVLDSFPAADGVKITVYKPEAPVNAKFSTVGTVCSLRRERAYLSLGSSLGDKKGYLDEGIKGLENTRGIEVKKVSSYIPTAPEGGVAQNEFLNCAAEIITYLSPRELLDAIHKIEDSCGRERKVRWGDRTLDIDIILYGGISMCEEGLIIPHPRAASREFVVKPLREIAPFLFERQNVKFCDK